MSRRLSTINFKLCLVKRDYDLFKFLFENRLATPMQIMKYVFKTDKERYPRQRLTKLRRYGHITRGLSDQIPGSIYYYLTNKGFQNLFPENSSVTCPNLKSLYPFHDYFLLEVTQKLKQSKFLQNYITESELGLEHNQWQTEEILGDDRTLFPDRLITLSINDTIIHGALELELSDKGSKRYGKLIEKYYRKSELSFIFYLYPKDSPIKNRVQTKEKELVGESIPKFFYIDYQTFLNENLPLTMHNVHGNSFELI